LAYWADTEWAPVFGSGGVAPDFSFDWATTSASSASVNFDMTSTPQITALGGTIFAFVGAFAFEGFSAPADGDINVAKAGRAIPLKWQAFDLGGNPVLDLGSSAVQVSSVSVPCESMSGETDALEAYASGSSGLQNLGDGSYQWNWATEKSWADTCRLVRLELGDRAPDGAPIYRTAPFRFTR
jgi:hypothetical protein